MTHSKGMERRVQRLERECRFLRGALALGALGLVGVVAMGQTAPPPKVVQAETFQVVDSRGVALASLGVDERMRSSLKLYAENGKPQVLIGASLDGGGSLGFIDRGEQPRVVLSSHPERGAAFTMQGNEKHHGVSLAMGPTGAGLNVGDGRVTLSLGADRGNGEFCINDGAAKMSASITRFSGGDVCLKLWDRDGKLFHCIPEGAHPESNPK